MEPWPLLAASLAKLLPKDSRELQSEFNDRAIDFPTENPQLEEGALEAKYEVLYQEIFKGALAPRATDGTAEHSAHPVMREYSRITNAYKEAMSRPEVKASPELQAAARRRCIDELNAIPGGPPGAKWGNSNASVYGHAFDRHGHKSNTPDGLKNRAADLRAPHSQVGLLLDEEFAAAVFGAIIKRGPGVHDVPLLPGLPAEVYLHDRSGPFPADFMRVVVYPNGSGRSGYPCSSKHPRGFPSSESSNPNFESE